MDTTDWKTKYIKYKTKYIELKKKFQKGGDQEQKIITEKKDIRIFFNALLNKNIISPEYDLKSISGNDYNKKLKDIDITNIDKITINYYGYDKHYEIYIKDITQINQFNEQIDTIKIIVKNDGETTKLFNELKQTWDFIE